ncbi:hypothetical protein SCHPADRAFT_893228 [Schizopora paradoxa]|uniref:Uncharacterized protein n=1 Tax=Schizopora paradoxa TaxID=27342 RepID=A0A0H2RIG8_9AGAM|nr:hypothetical protein SCHPADRAFT_893228 [Schizopora paradoxa]
MKISTSTSFVVASIALSSSALALPVPHTDPIPFARSPELVASPHAPHSARVIQESQMVSVARPGKGRAPAIRSGSGSRRSLPRRSKTVSKRDEELETDKSLTDVLGGALDSLESALAPLGLGLITPPAKEVVVESDATPFKPLRFAREDPQAASQPPIPESEKQADNAAAEQAEGYFPFEMPGTVAGMPGVIEGELPGFVPSYAGPMVPAPPAPAPPFAVPNGQPGLPAGFNGIPSQMMGELQTSESDLPAGAAGEAGQVPSELQNAVENTADGSILSGLPVSNVLGNIPVASLLNGLTPSQIQGLIGMLGSTAGQAGNLIPAGLPNGLGGLTGTVGGLTGSLPVVGGLNPFGALEGGSPSDGQDSVAESASSDEPSMSQSSMISSSESASETVSPMTSSTDASETTSSSSSSSSSAESEPTFAVNVAPDPAAVASSHSLPTGNHTLPTGNHTLPTGSHTLPTGSHSLPVPAPVQSKASSLPVSQAPQAPSPPIINVEAPSPTPSGTESGTETSSSFVDQSYSSFNSSSIATESASTSASTSSSSSSSSSASAEPTSSSNVNPAERRMLLSRITRFFRRSDPPLPKGFAAPTGPIPNDTPPLLQPSVNFPRKVKKDQAPATDADASPSVTSSAPSESQNGSSSQPEECEFESSSETTNESTVSSE